VRTIWFRYGESSGQADKALSRDPYTAPISGASAPHDRGWHLVSVGVRPQFVSGSDAFRSQARCWRDPAVAVDDPNRTRPLRERAAKSVPSRRRGGDSSEVELRGPRNWRINVNRHRSERIDPGHRSFQSVVLGSGENRCSGPRLLVPVCRAPRRVRSPAHQHRDRDWK
jgi:hypothetical protein